MRARVFLIVLVFPFCVSSSLEPGGNWLAPQQKQPTASDQPQSTVPLNRLITSKSVGPVRLGMTVAQARRVLPGMVLKRTADAEGVALIEVVENKKHVMTFYAGETDSEQPINERAKIEHIEVWGLRYATAEGVHPKMLLREVEKKYGKLIEIRMSDIESREYASFAKSPQGIAIRVEGPESGMAGVYTSDGRTTKRHDPSARIMYIAIPGW